MINFSIWSMGFGNLPQEIPPQIRLVSCPAGFQGYAWKSNTRYFLYEVCFLVGVSGREGLGVTSVQVGDVWRLLKDWQWEGLPTATAKSFRGIWLQSTNGFPNTCSSDSYAIVPSITGIPKIERGNFQHLILHQDKDRKMFNPGQGIRGVTQLVWRCIWVLHAHSLPGRQGADANTKLNCGLFVVGLGQPRKSQN